MGVPVPGHWYCPTGADYASQIQAKIGSTSLKAWDALHGNGNGNFSQAFPNLGSKVILTGPPGADGTRPLRVVEARRCESSAELRRRWRFALIRHPLRRLASAYHDKVVIERCIYEPFKWVCGLPPERRWRAFVGEVVAGRFRDVHVISQADGLLGSHVHTREMPLHALIRIEQLDAWWPYVLKCSHYQGSASEGALLHANSKPANYSEYFQDKELLAQLMQHSLREERWFGYSAVEVASSPAVAQAAAELQRHRWSTGDWSRHTPPSPLPPVHDDPPADKGQCVGRRPLHPEYPVERWRESRSSTGNNRLT